MVFRKITKKVRYLLTTLADRTKFAMISIGYLLRQPKYSVCFIASLFLFLLILSFFKNGNGNLLLLLSGISLSMKIELLGRVALSILDNFTDWYGLLIITLSALQALTIMLLIFAWRHREKEHAIDGASTGSVGAIFGFVALGCPTCGVSLLAPLLTAIAGASAIAVAESISRALTVLAFVLLIYTVIKLGYISFITISSNKYKEKKHAKGN